jgi:hypothetical protein
MITALTAWVWNKVVINFECPSRIEEVSIKATILMALILDGCIAVASVYLVAVLVAS